MLNLLETSTNASSYVFLRKKIRQLALNLKASEQDATLISSCFSDINQEYFTSWPDQFLNIKICVGQFEKKLYLLLNFGCQKGFLELEHLSSCRRCKKCMNPASSQQSFQMNLELIPIYHLLTPEFLSRQIQMLVQPSSYHELLTELKVNNKALNDARQNLESQVKQRTQELLEAKLIAQRSSETKSLFLANMSHELRTPMNGILGLNHLLSKTKLTDKQRNYVAKTQSSAANLLKILNDILDFSKVEAGKLRVENIVFNFGKILTEIADMLSFKLAEKKIKFVFNFDPNLSQQLIGDPLRFEQILINLSNNAIKFTEHGEVEIGGKILHETESEASFEFYVRDSGIGMTEEQLAQLFQAFSQADESISRKYGGTGLGLMISKTLVELMGGKIWATSTPDQGSSFYFTLKFGKPQHVPVLAKDHFPTELKELKILIVDDDEEIIVLIRACLEDVCEIVTASSAELGLEILLNTHNNPGQKSFDLILLDWVMEGMDGIDFCRQLQTLFPQRQRLNIILMSARHQIQQLSPRLKDDLAIEAILLKPFTKSVLYDTLLGAFDWQPPQTGDPLQGAVVISPPIPSLASFQNAEILLVEDNLINQEIAEDILSAEGLSITVADHGQMALDLLQQHPQKYELILMDLHMPILNGYEATQVIRKDKNFGNVPIIAMTADAIEGVRASVLAAGMNDYITKPIHIEALFSTLFKWLQPREISGTQTPEIASGFQADLVLPEAIAGQLNLAKINYRGALDKIRGNVELYQKLLKRFYRDHIQELDKIQDLLQLGAYAQAFTLAHNLKSLAGTLGMEALEQQLQKLEATLRADLLNTDAAHALLPDLLQNGCVLKSHLDVIFDALEAEPLSEHQSSAHDPETLKTLMAQLKACLHNFEYDAIDHLSQLKEGIHAPDLRAVIQEIQYKLDVFDFEASLEYYQKLEAMLID